MQSASQGKKREKPILSCTFCRGRKLRCDRNSPCGACLRRGKPTECTYISSAQQRKDAVDYRPHGKRQQARQRVARLENLVTEMRNMAESTYQPLENIPPPRGPPSDMSSSSTLVSDHGSDGMGKLSLTDGHAVYVGSSHWVSILEDIRLLKDELSDDGSVSALSRESTPLDVHTMQAPAPFRISLLTSVVAPTKEQILAQIPPRRVVDRLVSQFFNGFEFGSIILHRTKFLSEYADFWTHPADAPIMWVGLLCAIMSISVFLQQRDVGTSGASGTEPQNILETYRTLTIHCLISGNYLRPTKYTIETLLLHFAVDQNVNVDTHTGNWVLIGVIIRIAFRMGLHRDPSHWPNIRPLQAELRRRIWITLYQMDFFTSTQLGLPRIIKDSQCDTRPPAHLLDDDIGVEHDEIPSARPLTDATPLSHIIQRNIVIKIASEIYDATEAATVSSATITALSAKLERTIASIPAVLKYQSLENSIAEDPGKILYRILLDVLIHKAVYLLHRRSFIKGSAGEENDKSNELCIKAAMEILEHQQRMAEETQPGGLMFAIRWKVASSLNHEFLQATTMLCFALNRLNKGYGAKADASMLNKRDKITGALTIAKGFWEENPNRSVEAQTAVKAIEAVLQQVSGNQEALGFTNSHGLFEDITGLASQEFFDPFDFGQNMALDIPFDAGSDTFAAFGNMLDDLI